MNLHFVNVIFIEDFEVIFVERVLKSSQPLIGMLLLRSPGNEYV